MRPDSEHRIVPFKLDGKVISTACLWPDGTVKLFPNSEYRELLTDSWSISDYSWTEDTK